MKPTWGGASNVAPARRVRMPHAPWTCRCEAGPCPACGGLGWDVETRPACCGNYLPTGECCGDAIPEQAQVECPAGCWQGVVFRENPGYLVACVDCGARRPDEGR